MVFVFRKTHQSVWECFCRSGWWTPGRKYKIKAFLWSQKSFSFYKCFTLRYASCVSGARPSLPIHSISYLEEGIRNTWWYICTVCRSPCSQSSCPWPGHPCSSSRSLGLPEYRYGKITSTRRVIQKRIKGKIVCSPTVSRWRSMMSINAEALFRFWRLIFLL